MTSRKAVGTAILPLSSIVMAFSPWNIACLLVDGRPVGCPCGCIRPLIPYAATENHKKPGFPSDVHLKDGSVPSQRVVRGTFASAINDLLKTCEVVSSEIGSAEGME